MMKTITEIYKDIALNCEKILNALVNYKADNDNPEGRMIYQCRWLKEQAMAGTLAIPVNTFVNTLKDVFNNKLLEHVATSPARYHDEIEVFLYRLLNLVDGNLVMKHAYYPQVIQYIDKLNNIMIKSYRPLTMYESCLIDELHDLSSLFQSGNIELPLIYYLPDYPNFRKVYSMTGSTIDDLPGGKVLIKTVAHMVFEGIRPSSWITPEVADQEVSVGKGVNSPCSIF